MLQESTDQSTLATIADIIRAGKWKRSLFTTFTLSLTYFETEILRTLKKSGCSESWIITDTHGYKSSLSERTSWRIGHEYRLIPVFVKNGIFHPKCIYLEGEREDAILIGSGNLTFSGHGKSLEVFNLFNSSSNPDIFLDFSEFLISLKTRSDLTIPQSDWIDQFAARAESQAIDHIAASSEDSARLVHTGLGNSALYQIAQYCGKLGGCNSVNILSPFHNSEGDVVRSIANELGCTNIGILTTNGEESPFPFSKFIFARDIKIKAYILKIGDTRPLHAKWMEFSCRYGCIVLTGSINATLKSFMSADNIEVSAAQALEASHELLKIDDGLQTAHDGQRLMSAKRRPSSWESMNF
jgi:hypothetical protein